MATENIEYQSSSVGNTESNLSAVALAAILKGKGHDGYDYDHSGRIVSRQNISDLRKEVCDTKSDLKDTLQVQTLGQTNEFRGINDKIRDSKEEAIRANYETRLELKEQVCRVLQHVTGEVDKVRGQVNDFRISVNEKFCETNRNIDHKFCELTKDKLDECRQRNQTHDIINGIISRINPLCLISSGFAPVPCGGVLSSEKAGK